MNTHTHTLYKFYMDLHDGQLALVSRLFHFSDGMILNSVNMNLDNTLWKSKTASGLLGKISHGRLQGISVRALGLFRKFHASDHKHSNQFN